MFDGRGSRSFVLLDRATTHCYFRLSSSSNSQFTQYVSILYICNCKAARMRTVSDSGPFGAQRKQVLATEEGANSNGNVDPCLGGKDG